MLEQVKLKALRPITGDWGNADEGDVFTTDSRTAERLEARGGLVERYRESCLSKDLAEFLAKMVPVPQNKMIVPAQNKRGRPRKVR